MKTPQDKPAKQPAERQPMPFDEALKRVWAAKPKHKKVKQKSAKTKG